MPDHVRTSCKGCAHIARVRCALDARASEVFASVLRNSPLGGEGVRAPQGRLPSSQRDLGGLERGDSRGAFPQTVAEPAAAGARLGQQWPGVALFACSAPALSKPLASSLLSLSPFLSRLFASSLLSRI